MGRAFKATEEARAECIRLIRLGLSKTDAAAMAGITKPRFYQLAKEGADLLADGETKDWKAQFAIELEKAEAQFKLSASAVIVNAANGAPAQFDAAGNVVRAERAPDWKAAAWMLERRYRDEYGTRQVEVTGAGGGAIEVEVATVETLVARVHALRPVHDPLALPPGSKGGNGSTSNGHSNGAAGGGG